MTEDVTLATTGTDREAALAVRRRVFVEEQDVPEDRELDGRDDEATHFVARAPGATDGCGPAGDVVGTARLRAYDEGGGSSESAETAKVERVAVLPSHRDEGWGRRLMEVVERHATIEGFARVRLNAQVPVVPFYERLGYEVVSEEFEDAGIPHRTMEKRLQSGE